MTNTTTVKFSSLVAGNIVVDANGDHPHEIVSVEVAPDGRRTLTFTDGDNLSLPAVCGTMPFHIITPGVVVVSVADMHGDPDNGTDIRLSNGVRIVCHANGDMVISHVDGLSWSFTEQIDMDDADCIDLELNRPR